MKRILLLFFMLFTFLIAVPINANALIVDFGSTTSIVETGTNSSGAEYRYIDVLANEDFDITISIGLVDFTSAAFGFDLAIDNNSTAISYSGYTIENHFYSPLLSDPFQVDGIAIHDTHNPGLLATLSLNAGSMLGTGILDLTGPYSISDFTGLYDLRGTNLSNVDLEGSLIINILESNPVPEPGTILLVGMGLLGLAGTSRKKS